MSSATSKSSPEGSRCKKPRYDTGLSARDSVKSNALSNGGSGSGKVARVPAIQLPARSNSANGRRPSGSSGARSLNSRSSSAALFGARTETSRASPLSTSRARNPAVSTYRNPKRTTAPVPTSPRNSNASRKLVVRGMSLSRTEDISRAPNGVDHLRQPAFLELAAQPANVDIDHIGLGVVMIAPDLLEQHRAGNHPTRVPHQVFEEAILARQ